MSGLRREERGQPSRIEQSRPPRHAGLAPLLEVESSRAHQRFLGAKEREIDANDEDFLEDNYQVQIFAHPAIFDKNLLRSSIRS